MRQIEDRRVTNYAGEMYLKDSLKFLYKSGIAFFIM